MELYSLNEAFYTQQMMNPMSSGQIALWHALVRIANKSRWPDWFSIAGITLVQLSGLSIAGVKKARNELKQRGLIDFRANGTKATSYHLNDIQESSQDGSRNSSQDGSRNSSQDGSRNSSALRILNNTESTPTIPRPTENGGGGAPIETDSLDAQTEEETENSYIADNIPGMSAGNWEELRSFLDDGLDMPLIRHAVDEAAAQGKRTWAYVRRILNRYVTSGIRTVEQAKATDGKPAASAQPKRMETRSYVQDGKRYTYQVEVAQ